MSEITYYLVRKLDPIGWLTHEYYCITSSGDPAITENPKRAMRWHSQEGAEQFAARLGWRWTAEEVHFRGDEPAYESEGN